MKTLFALVLLVSPLMAESQTLYWIGGSGNWSDVAHWSSSSGGPSCGCVPTQNDNVEFNASSGAGPSVTINAQAYCKDMTWTSGLPSPSIAGSSALDIYGSLTLTSGMSITYTGAIRFKSTTASQRTITTAGNQLRSSLTFDGAGAQWDLQDSFVTYNTGSSLTLAQGTLNTNGQYVYLSRLYSTGNQARALALGSSIIELAYNSGGGYFVWDLSSTNMSFSAGTSLIRLTGASTRFDGGNLPYHDVEFQNTSTSYLDGNNTFHDVSFTGDAVFHLGSNTFNNLALATSKAYSWSGTQTILGSLTANGTCSVPMTLEGGTISKPSGTVTINYVYLTNLAATGGATFIANNVTDFGGNTGWTLNTPTPQTLYWVGGNGNWTDANHWSDVPGGTGGTCIPTIYDNVEFNAQSGFGPSVTINAQAYCKDMTWTSGLSSPSIAGSSALDIYGSLTLTTGMSITYTGAIRFKSTAASQRTITTAGNQLRSSLTFDGVGAQWVLQDPFVTYNTGSSLTLTRGSLNTNGQYVYLSRLNSAGNLARALTLGSSEIDLTYTGTGTTMAWDLASTNMNFSGGTSRIVLTGATSRFTGGNLPYHDVEFQNTGTSYLTGNNTFHDVSFTGNASISGNSTFHDLTLGVSKTYTFGSGSTQTLLGELVANGTSANPTIMTGSGACTTRISKATGTVCISYCTVNNLCAIGGASFGTQNCTLNASTGWLPNSCPGLSCSASLSPTSISAAPSSSGYSVYLSIPAPCAWSVTGVPAWITWTSPLSGTGPATLGFTVQANPGPDPRSATITVAGEALFVSQALPGCSYAISPSNNLSVSAAGATGQTVSVTAAAGCGWTAAANAPWITITAGFAGFGNGTVTYNIANHAGASPRSGSLTIAGQIFQVTQLGVGSTATYTISASTQPEYANFPNTTLSTAPLKICADGSRATWVTVTVSGTGGVPTSALRFKLHNATPDLAYSGAFNNPYNTSVPGQANTRLSHPTYVASGNTPYRTDILEVYEDGNDGVILASCPVRIYRTPIAFIHGLVGGQSTFQTMTTSMLSNNMYPNVAGLSSGSPLLYRVDYTLSSVQHFHNNRFVVPNAIDYVVGQAIGNGYSCGKAAVLGHSMGGVLSRLYLYSMNSVSYREDMNRLVTINTPHRGTQFANFCGTLFPNPGCGPVLSMFSPLSSLSGAVKDLKVGSKPIKRMNTWPQWDNVPCAALSSDELGDASATAARLALSFALSPLWNIYDSEAHDLIVPETSQTSGLGNYPTAAQQWHIGSAANSNIIGHVKQMLDVNPTNALFYSQTGFPQGLLNFFLQGPVDQMSADDDARAVASIEILNPPAGTVYSPSSTVTLDISHSDITDMALIVTGASIDPIAIDTVAVNQLSFQVPANAVGTLTIFLLGGDGTDWTVSDDTYITISSPVVPDSVVCTPNQVTLPLGLTQYIQANGYFGNTTPVDLYGSLSLTVSPGGAVLGYDDNGVFQGLSVGSVDIVFDYLGVGDTVHFTVVDDPSALVAGFDYSTEEVCAGSSVTFTDESQGLITGRAWTFQGGSPASSSDSIPSVTYATPGQYSVQLITTFANGSDTLTLDSLVTVLPGPDLSVVNGATLFANESGVDATYQWLDCDNGNAPIPGETNQEFIPTANGNYAVAVTNGTCAGTSACYNYISTNLSTVAAHNGISVNPNPTRGAMVVSLPTLASMVRIEVKDVTGRLVLIETFKDTRQVQLQLNEPSGVYMLSVQIGDTKTSFRVVKQ